jgi:hypothetical protein
MNAQIPIPSFDDIRKLLHFWFDQQDKWFYFELGMVQIGKSGEILKTELRRGALGGNQDKTKEIFQYTQSRIIGKIYNVVEYPPSLLLHDVTIFTAKLLWGDENHFMKNIEKRNQYGLVFSQITYYEPVENIDFFISNDIRVQKIRN